MDLFFLLFVCAVLLVIFFGLLLGLSFLLDAGLFIDRAFSKKRPRLSNLLLKGKEASDFVIVYYGLRLFLASVGYLIVFWFYRWMETN